MLANLKFALRQLAKSPGFTLVAVLTLTIAIGVNSAIFSLLNSVLLRSGVPYQPDEVACIYTTRQDARREFRPFSFAEFQTLRKSPEVFADVAAVTFNQVSLGRGEALRRAMAFTVSDNYFSLMGVQPAAGRFFSAGETAPNAGQRVVVAGYVLWQREGARADFIGSSIIVNGQPHIVIGVAPEGFCGISALVAPELWLPFGLFAEVSPAFGETRSSLDLSNPTNYAVSLIGRMQPGLTLAVARAHLPVLAERLDALQPAESKSLRELVLKEPFSISPKPEDARPLRIMGLLLLAMSGIVLVIACLNLANMMLARGAARSGEIALRLALGATRRQIVGQLLVEGLVLAGLGGALGLVLSLWANNLLQNYFSAVFSAMNFTLTAKLQPDAMVITATFLFCLVSTLIFSLGPALKASRADLVRDLKAHAGDPAVTGRWNRFFSGRHLLVMAQMSLSLVLVFSAGIFVRSALKAGGAGYTAGFRSEGVVLAEFDFSLASSTPLDVSRRLHAVLERVRQLPGVQSAALASLVPYNNEIALARLLPADAPRGDAANPAVPKLGQTGIFTAITCGYFSSIGVPLVRGRDFTDEESSRAQANQVCIVDEGMAAKLFPGENAVGRRVRFTEAPPGSQPGEMEIVGIVKRHSHGVEDLGKPVAGVYVPLAQTSKSTFFLTARLATEKPPVVLNALGDIRRSLNQLDSDLPLIQLLPFTDFTRKNFTLWMVQLGAVMFGVFGAVALLLAVIGVYAVKSYAVTRRTREMGIRLALGADRLDVLALVMKQGALQTACSVALGLTVCLLVGRVLGSVFFQVDALDPLTFITAALLLTVTSLLACWQPARRATRVDPMIALRAE